MTLLREEDDLDYQVANLAEDIANDPRVKEVMASYMFECMMGTYGSIEEEMRKTQNLIKELSMRPRVLLTLQDKDQPARRDEVQPTYPGRWDWGLGGFTHFGSNMTFKVITTPLYAAWNLRKRLSGKG